jgi:hypothetical protein
MSRKQNIVDALVALSVIAAASFFGTLMAGLAILWVFKP